MTWTTGEIAAANCHGTLTIGSQSLNTKAWAVTNLYVLWNPADRRGENSLIPGRPGRIAHPKRKDQTTRTLELLVIGDCNPTGTVTYADRAVGLKTNWLVLKNGLFASTATTLTATLALPGGGSLTGAVQIERVELGAPGVTGALTAAIDVTLPDGELV